MTEAQDPVQDAAEDPVVWASEVQEYTNNLMA